MTELKRKIKDFVPVPRKIRDDFVNGKLTKNEFDVLIWIWLNTNPVNGFFSTSYGGLGQDFRNNISYDNMRKIISSLRKTQYIYFLNRKGRRGPFAIYPIDFLLTNGVIQTLDYLKNKIPITSQSQPNIQSEAKLDNNLEGQYHNLNKQKDDLLERFSIDRQKSQITTPYNDTKKDIKNNDTLVKKPFKGIGAREFQPDSSEKTRCKEIALDVGEKYINTLLKVLRTDGLTIIEKAWGIFREDRASGKQIENPPAYFYGIIKRLKTKENGDNSL